MRFKKTRSGLVLAKRRDSLLHENIMKKRVRLDGVSKQQYWYLKRQNYK